MKREGLLQILLHESDRKGLFGRLIFEDVVRYLWRSGAPGVTVYRSEEGLDKQGHIQNMHSEYMSEQLPIKVEVFANQEELQDIMEHLHKEIQDARGQAFMVPEAWNVKQEDWRGENPEMQNDSLLKVFMKEEDEYNGTPLYHAFVRELQKLDIQWVNVIRALEGFGQDHVIRKTKMFQFANHSPVVLEAVLSASKVHQTLETLKPFIQAASGPAILLSGNLVASPAGKG
ncbi:DUF190 domain-containing protein [Alicyclobacillus shizuokensis]|uniref:DUF190 domain-containing protein n=1 Tax=Alicyclobacillus shizuokensis TaxID=392014 RepID=UPI00082C4B72|nr:DUF190 domain-containing protein [Alicyclobacillus shizuokensis]MCL6625071.1 DUF190 domain-containing protein [Alicyclobacillus shizuokensis]